MKFFVALQQNTALANVRYKWISAGVASIEQSGATQPAAAFPLFRVVAEPPTDAEQIMMYDATDPNNWNVTPLKFGL